MLAMTTKQPLLASKQPWQGLQIDASKGHAVWKYYGVMLMHLEERCSVGLVKGCESDGVGVGVGGRPISECILHGCQLVHHGWATIIKSVMSVCASVCLCVCVCVCVSVC